MSGLRGSLPATPQLWDLNAHRSLQKGVRRKGNTQETSGNVRFRCHSRLGPTLVTPENHAQQQRQSLCSQSSPGWRASGTRPGNEDSFSSISGSAPRLCPGPPTLRAVLNFIAQAAPTEAHEGQAPGSEEDGAPRGTTAAWALRLQLRGWVRRRGRGYKRAWTRRVGRSAPRGPLSPSRKRLQKVAASIPGTRGAEASPRKHQTAPEDSSQVTTVRAGRLGRLPPAHSGRNSSSNRGGSGLPGA